MPILTAERLPKYRKQAIITLIGRDHYLGPHGTKDSRSTYDRLIAVKSPAAVIRTLSLRSSLRRSRHANC
jgi:hypothetical protein